MIREYLLLLIFVGTYKNCKVEAGNGKACRQQHWRQEFQPRNTKSELVDEFLARMVDEVHNLRCRKQMITFRHSLANSSLWAVEMLDANAKIPQGLLSSDAFDPGNYDGCLAIDLKRESQDNILGRYCLATLSISQPTSLNEVAGHEENDEFNGPMFDQLMISVLRCGFKNKVLQLGVCFPHECSPLDVETMLRFLFNNVAKINFKINVFIPENGCIASAERHELGTPMSRTFFAMFCGVVLITTLQVCSISHRFQLPGFMVRFVLPFSAYKNYKYLVQEHINQRLPVVDGLKVCTLILLTVVRRFAFMMNSPLLNRRYVDKILLEDRRKSILAVCNDLIVVCFMVISGFLHHQNTCKIGFRHGIWRTSLLQLFKLIPLYATVIVFFAFEFDKLGDGPLWTVKVKNPTASCRLLLGFPISLQNLTKINSLCLFEPWYYVVVALHFVILTSLVAPISFKCPTMGWVVLGLLTVACHLLMPLHGVNITDKTKTEFSATWRHTYQYSVLTQAQPYVVGIGSSMIYYKLKKKNRQSFLQKLFKKLVKFIAVILFFGTFPFPFMSGLIKFIFEGDPKWRQIIWSLTVSWIMVQGSLDGIPYLSRVLNHRYLTFFGSFTYPYVLMLGFIQGYTSGTAKTLEYFSYSRLIWMSMADVVSTYIFAFVFYMMMHKPISKILEEKMLKGKTNDRNRK